MTLVWSGPNQTEPTFCRKGRVIDRAKTSIFRLLILALTTTAEPAFSATDVSSANSCPDQFATLMATIDSSAKIQARKTGFQIGPEARSALIAKFDTAKSLALNNDLKSPSHFEKGPGKTQIPVYKIRSETVESMNAVNLDLKVALEKLGYKVKIVRVPASSAVRNGKIFEIPERDILQLAPGSANDDLTRELSRTEKWDTARRNEAGFPKQLNSLRVIVDPVETLTSEAYASFSAMAAGPTIRLTPHALLSLKGSGEEAFRHELRHLKAYYDVVSGRPTVYRGALVAHGARNLTGENLGVYQRFFSFDELEGFMLNLKETGARAGKAREEMRQLAKSELDVRQHTNSYNEKMTELRILANGQFRQISAFADSIDSGIQSARMLFEAATSQRQLNAMMKINPEYPSHPGNRLVEVDLSNSGKRDGIRLTVLIPESQIRMNRPEEVRNYILKYLDDLEIQTKEIRAEAERRKKMIRDDAAGLYQ